jgi:hypothetical protein
VDILGEHSQLSDSGYKLPVSGESKVRLGEGVVAFPLRVVEPTPPARVGTAIEHGQDSGGGPIRHQDHMHLPARERVMRNHLSHEQRLVVLVR